MKKAIFTFGLFSMVLVLTSFTTPFEKSAKAIMLPAHFQNNFDIEPGTVSPTVRTQKLDYADSASPTVMIDQMDFEPGTVSPTVRTNKLD